MTTYDKPRLVVRNGAISSNGASSRVELAPNLQSTARDALNLESADVRNDRAPLGHGREGDAERTSNSGVSGHVRRDIRGALKVINNVLLEHDLPYTRLKGQAQPQFKTRSLTSGAMDKRLTTLADRLSDAMTARSAETGTEITKSDLARACNVSPAAVGKWITGETKQLKAENYRDAARALWVREEWLRDGKLPRERDANGDADLHLERVMGLLEDLSGPLSALVTAIEQIKGTRTSQEKGRKKA
jgi:transcriptional regulator with XRE-family HTH domain